MPAPYSIKWRGEIVTAETAEEFHDLVGRATQSAEIQALVNPDDPWEWEILVSPEGAAPAGA